MSQQPQVPAGDDAGSAGIDQATFRHVLGHYPTGVTVVTGVTDDGDQLAMVVGTFTSVSLDPPLVAFLPMRTSRTFEAMRQCRTLCVNVLTGDQEKIGRTIASRREDKLAGIPFHMSPHGAPILERSLAWFDVRLDQTVEAGDHWIALCEVLDMGVGEASPPLIFFQGGYGSFVVQSLIARIDEEIMGPVKQGAAARSELESLADELGAEAQLLAAINPDELVAVATAWAPGINAEENLGVRIPIVPPIGDTYISGGDAEEMERWLAKVYQLEDDERKVFETRIDRCRRDGHLVSFLPDEGPVAYEAMRSATQRFGQGRLTPAEEREIRAAISRGAVNYDIFDIEDDTIYSVGSIVMPVPDGSDRTIFTLRTSQLPPRQEGRVIKGWINQLRRARDTISEILIAHGR